MPVILEQGLDRNECLARTLDKDNECGKRWLVSLYLWPWIVQGELFCEGWMHICLDGGGIFVARGFGLIWRCGSQLDVLRGGIGLMSG